MSKKSSRRDPKRSLSARIRAFYGPMTFMVGGKKVEIVFDAASTPSEPPAEPPSPPPNDEPYVPGPGELPFTNNPG